MLERSRTLETQYFLTQELETTRITLSAEKLDLADIIKTIDFLERLFAGEMDLGAGWLEFALIAAL